MEISDLKQQIVAKQFSPFYIFYGEEYKIMKIYLKMMADNANLEITYVDSLMDLMSGVRTKTLFNSSHLYVIMNDKEFLLNENMWIKFKGLKDDIVVFYYTDVDKRLKFWKNNKDRAIEFKKLDIRVLTKYIKKEVPFNDESCKKLIEVCDSDYGRILLELDKFKSYVAGVYGKSKDVDPDSVLDELMDKGAIYRQPKDAIFAFIDAVLERSPSKAYNLLQQSKEVGESNLNIIFNLYNSMKVLLQVQSSSDYHSLGLNNWQIFNVKAHSDNYSNGELVRAMRLLRKIERGIKTGEIPDELSVEYFLVQTI